MLTSSHATRADLFRRFGELGIESQTVEHAPLFTVAESSKVELELSGGPTKNLFLKDAKGRLYLVVALHETAVDLKALPARIGSARLSFASAALMQEVLGVTPGSVTAFALMNDRHCRVGVILDAALAHCARITAHPLENTATTSVALDDLLRFIRACGHEPRMVTLDEPHL